MKKRIRIVVKDENPNRFYVYVLIDPRTGDPFYVGKGSGYRINDHLHVAKLRLSRNQILNSKEQTLIDIMESGFEHISEKLEVGLTNDDALSREKYYVEKYGRKGLGTGTLTNGRKGLGTGTLTNGRNGGPLGENPDPEILANNSIKMKSKFDDPEYTKIHRQKTFNPEVQSRRTDSVIEMHSDPEHNKIHTWGQWSRNPLWKKADIIFKLYQEKRFLYRSDRKFIVGEGLDEYRNTLSTFFKKFKEGWIPSEDLRWIEYSKMS